MTTSIELAALSTSSPAPSTPPTSAVPLLDSSLDSRSSIWNREFSLPSSELWSLSVVM